MAAGNRIDSGGKGHFFLVALHFALYALSAALHLAICALSAALLLALYALSAYATDISFPFLYRASHCAPLKLRLALAVKDLSLA